MHAGPNKGAIPYFIDKPAQGKPPHDYAFLIVCLLQLTLQLLIAKPEKRWIHK